MIERFKKQIKKLLFQRRGVVLKGGSSLNWNVGLTRVMSTKVEIENSYVMCSSIGEGTKISRAMILGDVTLGRYVSIFGPGTIVSSVLNSIEIGPFTSIGQGVHIQDSYHNYHRATSYLIRKNIFKEDPMKDFISKGKVIIGRDVWIGSGSVILSGIEIGDGAIVAAGSVVTKSVGKYEIWAGNPASFKKMRHSEGTIQQIEDSGWWHWSLEKILANSEFFE